MKKPNFDKLFKKITKKFASMSRFYLPIFMFGSILITFCLVVVSMTIYDKSGAAQLDLSRPGYVSVRAQSITNDNDFQSYSSTGSINKKSISEFKKVYDTQAGKAKAVDAFGSDPLSPESLGIGDPTPVDASSADQ